MPYWMGSTPTTGTTVITNQCCMGNITELATAHGDPAEPEEGSI